MSTNSQRLNHVLGSQEVLDIENALDLLEANLSFLPTITEEERTHKVRLGVNNWGFVRTAKQAYEDQPELLPRFIDVDDYQNDLELLERMIPYRTRLTQIMKLFEDSSILLGDFAYKDALGIFHAAQEAAKRGVPGAQLWLERMEPRFAWQRNRPTEDAETDEDGMPVLSGGGIADGNDGEGNTNSGSPTDGSPLDGNPSLENTNGNHMDGSPTDGSPVNGNSTNAT